MITANMIGLFIRLSLAKSEAVSRLCEISSQVEGTRSPLWKQLPLNEKLLMLEANIRSQENTDHQCWLCQQTMIGKSVGLNIKVLCGSSHEHHQRRSCTERHPSLDINPTALYIFRHGKSSAAEGINSRFSSISGGQRTSSPAPRKQSQSKGHVHRSQLPLK